MFNAIGIKAIICCPLVKGGRLVAMMAVHQARRATGPRARWRWWKRRGGPLLGPHRAGARPSAMLREQDRRKDEFLATLAHELRNPLAPIRNGLELLRLAAERSARGARADDGPPGRAHGRLINDLLDIARINRGLIQCCR
jgi:signal transduction histidine kinase